MLNTQQSFKMRVDSKFKYSLVSLKHRDENKPLDWSCIKKITSQMFVEEEFTSLYVSQSLDSSYQLVAALVES